MERIYIVQKIRSNIITAVVCKHSLDALINLPHMLNIEHSKIKIITDSSKRASLLRQYTNIPCITIEDYEGNIENEKVIFIDLYAGIGNIMYTLLQVIKQKLKELNCKIVLCSSLSLINNLPWIGKDNIYELKQDYYPVEIRYQPMIKEPSKEILALVRNLPGKTLIITPNSIQHEKLKNTLEQNKISVVDLNETNDILDGYIYIITEGADLLELNVNNIISAPKNRSLAEIHTAIVDKNPSGISYRLYDEDYFQQLPIINTNKEDYCRQVLRAKTWGYNLDAPDEVYEILTRLQVLDNIEIGKWILQMDLPVRLALLLLHSDNINNEALYSAIVIVALLENSPFLYYQSEMEMDDQIRFFRDHYGASNDLQVLIQIWKDYKSSPLTLEGWCNERSIRYEAMKRTLALISKLETKFNLSIKETDIEITIPYELLYYLYEEMKLKKASNNDESNLYTDGLRMYQYTTKGKISTLSQKPPTQIISLKTITRGNEHYVLIAI